MTKATAQELDITPMAGQPNSPFALRARVWNGQMIGVPYFVPIGASANILSALDLLIKGAPSDLYQAGVAWIDITDTNEGRLLLDDYETIRIGKHTAGAGHVSMIAGSASGNAIRPLILQIAGGNVLIGTSTDGMTANGSLAIAQDLAHRGTKAGFYNKTPATQPKKASHNNWASLADVVRALAELGLIDSA